MMLLSCRAHAFGQHLMLLALFLSVPFAQATSIRCFSIFDCEQKVAPGSECVDGFCSNPYHREGCLAKHKKDHYKIRTCHSEDPASSVQKGYCRPSELDYMEVRVSSQNWESVFFVSWILQILLSEILDVPVTIETSSPDANVDFYDQMTRFQYGGSNDFDAIRTSYKVKDCRRVKGNEPCAHVIPEVWSAHLPILEKMRIEGVIETPGGLGALGHQMWFMRKKTALKYPELMSYAGLEGPEARLKLASIFKRPTTWKDYCTLVSANGCRTPDEYAQRAPIKEDGEEGIYFMEDAYRGYFRATEQNNCTALPDTCTGHIVDYPCGWTGYVFAQTHHLDIALESNGNQPGSNGYSYGEMNQIWTAANETDSDLIMLWWRPEALYHKFLGTDSEFSSITLPPPTQECIEHRVPTADLCSEDMSKRLGDPRGACMEEPHALTKVISSALFDISFDPKLPEALHSPAFDAIDNFRITDLQMGEMFERWFNKTLDPWGLDPRDAVCEWVIENFELVEAFTPRTHPRVVVDNDQLYKLPVFYVAMAISCVAIVTSFVVAGLTYWKRAVAAIRLAQIEFLMLLLVGLFMVSFGALLQALSPSDFICIFIGWLINLGYTLEVVPLIVKVAAIHRVMVAHQQHRRVELRMASLYGSVAVVVAIVGIVLVVWTVVDPPLSMAAFTLTTEDTPGGQTIVERAYYCSSDNAMWEYFGVGWQLLLLLCASVLAFNTRHVREDLSETKTLAMMIYSHFVFVILIAISYMLDGSLDSHDVAAARSMIYSLDTLATLGIYFVPKFLQQNSSDSAKLGVLGTNSQMPSGERDSQPLPIHKWHSKQGSRSRAGSGSTPEQPSNSVEPLTSLRDNSVDYKTQAELEEGDNNGNGLDQISEEVSVTSHKDED